MTERIIGIERAEKKKIQTIKIFILLAMDIKNNYLTDSLTKMITHVSREIIKAKVDGFILAPTES